MFLNVLIHSIVSRTATPTCHLPRRLLTSKELGKGEQRSRWKVPPSLQMALWPSGRLLCNSDTCGSMLDVFCFKMLTCMQKHSDLQAPQCQSQNWFRSIPTLFFANWTNQVVSEPEIKVGVDIFHETPYWLSLNFAALLVALREKNPPVYHEIIPHL